MWETATAGTSFGGATGILLFSGEGKISEMLVREQTGKKSEGEDVEVIYPSIKAARSSPSLPTAY